MSTTCCPDFIDHQLTTNEVRAKCVAGSTRAFQYRVQVPDYTTSSTDDSDTTHTTTENVAVTVGGGLASVVVNEVLADEPGAAPLARPTPTVSSSTGTPTARRPAVGSSTAPSAR
ncbi:hypothetical protein [Streptomyces sp. A1499]|uniref:hypothetical protein n=1 Tax=Streptomyces sp. A1499 TaxID=2563104 RepID=UPI00109E95DB|nr:hypothetical protein [Streptomyces sp. A1499]THC47398.1 hypothetical protein E7X58_28265 [Streptomyces sp. A1499]